MIRKYILVYTRNFYDPINPSREVDLIIAFDLRGATVQSVKLPNGNIKILSKKDLIKMKKVSGRKQDLEDIKSLEQL